MSETALAIFVKTPGLSQIKTRLAATLGESEAESFYELACRATLAVAREASRLSEGHIVPYWAIAEHDALTNPLYNSRWTSLPQIWQGEGGLGERLSHVYGELLERHGSAIVMGADSPQLNASVICQAGKVVSRNFVLGRAADGGFYLFGGSIGLKRELWTTVDYSTSDTAEMLSANVRSVAEVSELATETDVDTIADFQVVRAVLRDRVGLLLEEQKELLNWMDSRAAH